MSEKQYTIEELKELFPQDANTKAATTDPDIYIQFQLTYKSLQTIVNGGKIEVDLPPCVFRITNNEEKLYTLKEIIAKITREPRKVYPSYDEFDDHESDNDIDI